MPSRRTGFTLLEVLLALLLITLGLLGIAGSLGPVSALAGAGRARGRSAAVLESRLDRMRLELLGSAPACVPPAAGTQRHEDGVVESWRATARTGTVELLIEAQLPGRNSRPDSLLSLLACP